MISRATCCRSPCEYLPYILVAVLDRGTDQGDRADATEPAERQQSAYKSLGTFTLDKDRPYQQQYGDMYFLRLAKIKPAVEQIAATAWGDTVIGGEPAQKVERVLDVRQGELCWVAGTVYMDMPLKPSILDDVSKDVGLAHGLS